MDSAQPLNSALCTDDKRIQRADCAHCAIRTRMLFADIDMEAAAKLLEPITNIQFRANETLYLQGGDSHALYSIRSGLVKLSVVSPDGDLRIVRLLGPGAAIGLEGLLQQPYQHTAETLSAVDACRLPSATVLQIAAEQPQLYQRLMQEWGDQVEQADAHLLNLSAGPVNERVIYLLQLLGEICGRNNSPFVLPTNQDCAALVAARIESVSRVMAELKRAGVLASDNSGGWTLNNTLIHGAATTL